jgi:hypothetical protein
VINHIPETALSQHIAVLGKTGSGKTFAFKGIVEQLLAAGRRVGIVDPTGAWWGLRSSADGKASGFPVLVLGGEHGDLPLPALGGAAVARLLVEQGVNLVADTSQLTVGERTRWFIDFATTLYRLNRSPLHLVLDEAHNFAPKGKIPDPDTGRMLHATNTLASGGRSRGIRLAMLTQRPQKLHNDALTSADTLVAMRLLAPHDRLAVEDWIKGCGDIAAGKEVLNSLASLQRGEGWVWYPEGSYLKRVKFPPIRTFDSSATPTDGKIAAAPQNAAAIDLTEIRAALADAAKEAEANDPKLLQKRITELERQIAGRAPAAATGVPEAEVQRRIAAAVAAAAPAGSTASKKLQAAIDKIAAGLQEAQAELAGVPPEVVPRARTVVRQPTAAPASAGPVSEGVSAPQQRVLDVLAQLEAFGVGIANKNMVAAHAGVSPTSGGYFNNLGKLRTMGLIDYPAGGTVTLTDSGRGKANAPKRAPTLQDLHDSWLRIVSAPQAAILRELLLAYPGAIHKDLLADRVGVSRTSGGYFNNLGHLRTIGAIDYPEKGHARAEDILFPKGRR